jgi:hypothetical protein
MNLQNQAVCKRCGQGMELVANIAPTRTESGLVAFLCMDCGATESALVYPGNRSLQADHEQPKKHGERGFRIMSSGEGHWYWEVVTGDRAVITRGVADNEPAAYQQASAAVRQASLS